MLTRHNKSTFKYHLEKQGCAHIENCRSQDDAVLNYNKIIKKEKHHVDLINLPPNRPVEDRKPKNKINEPQILIEQEKEQRPLSPLDNIKAKLGELTYAQIGSKIEKIGTLIDKYYDFTGNKKELFYEKLAHALHMNKNSWVVKTAKEDESPLLDIFLNGVHDNLLKPRSNILDDYINIFFHKIALNEKNTRTATLPSYVFEIVDMQPSVLPDNLCFEGPVEDKIKQVVIPVNINNVHWMLYLFLTSTV